MGKKYRIYVIGDTPNDLRARIAEIHASAILKSKRDDAPTNIKGPKNKNLERRDQ